MDSRYHSVIYFGLGDKSAAEACHSAEARNCGASECLSVIGSESLGLAYPAAACAGADFGLEWRFVLDIECSWQAVVEELQKDTIFSFSRELAQTFAVSRIKFFFGADTRPRRVFREGEAPLLAFKGAACTAKTNLTRRIDIRSLAGDSRVICSSLRISDLIGQSLRAEVDRHKMCCKLGAVIEYGGTLRSHDERIEIVGGLLRLEEMVSAELRFFLDKQISALESRIKKAGSRQKLYLGGRFVGVVPKNEVETLVIFLRYLALSNNTLPGGASIELLDFSPRGIDAVCIFAPNANTPALTVPVEFEFELENFFLHGHDHEQVKVIVCFQAEKGGVGWESFGISYWLERGSGLAVLRNSRDSSFIHCVILGELIKG